MRQKVHYYFYVIEILKRIFKDEISYSPRRFIMWEYGYYPRWTRSIAKAEKFAIKKDANQKVFEYLDDCLRKGKNKFLSTNIVRVEIGGEATIKNYRYTLPTEIRKVEKPKNRFDLMDIN